ncbi:MAG: DUF2207 domain-containing protein [Synergistaceae bacterium]|nr:DUF2207 domain-containing protein [Synergistaceae bacterium]
MVLWAVLSLPGDARGEAPVIENLEVFAAVTQNGILSVEETLTVLFEGTLSADLTRGISGHYSSDEYKHLKTGFVLLNATLDEHPTKISIRRNPDSLRLTLAAEGDHFSPGRHVFKLKYELINMIVPQTFPQTVPQTISQTVPRSDNIADLLIWSLVRESSCPILRISVEVKLPDTPSATSLDNRKEPSPFRLFTGYLSDYREGEKIHIERPGLMRTTARLPEGKAFTLHIAWDKGLVIHGDRRVSPWRYWDLGVMILLFVYYVFTGLTYGRSPKRQTASLSFEPPENLSPGLLRCIRDAGMSARALTAEILNLAVKGYIHLYNFTAGESAEDKTKSGRKRYTDTKARYSLLEYMMERKYRLHLNLSAATLPPDALPSESIHSESIHPKTLPSETLPSGTLPSGALPPLSAGENILLFNLFGQRGNADLILDETCAPRLRASFRALARNFSEQGRRYFFQHMKRWGWGLALFEGYTAFVMFQTLSQGVGGIEPGSEHALAFMAPLFFLTPLLGGEKIWKQSTPMFILRTGIPFFFCACSLAILRQQGMDPLSISALIGSIAVMGFFWKAAPIRSEEGQNLLDKIEGFQMGLGSRGELKEQDTIEKFETLLPYAYALDLEQSLIARYDPLISPSRHHAKWHTSETRGFSGGSEHYMLSYELGEAVNALLQK